MFTTAADRDHQTPANALLQCMAADLGTAAAHDFVGEADAFPAFAGSLNVDGWDETRWAADWERLRGRGFAESIRDSCRAAWFSAFYAVDGTSPAPAPAPAVGSPEAIAAIRAADPITLPAARVLGWLEARGGSATQSALDKALAPRTTYPDGMVVGHTALVGTGVLYRRGLIRREGDVVSLTTAGLAFFSVSL